MFNTSKPFKSKYELYLFFIEFISTILKYHNVITWQSIDHKKKNLNFKKKKKMKANKKDKNKSKWHSQASHLHLIVPFPRPHIEAMRSTPILFDANQPRILEKKKRGEKKKRKKKIRTRAFWIEIYISRAAMPTRTASVFFG